MNLHLRSALEALGGADATASAQRDEIDVGAQRLREFRSCRGCPASDLDVGDEEEQEGGRNRQDGRDGPSQADPECSQNEVEEGEDEQSEQCCDELLPEYVGGISVQQGEIGVGEREEFAVLQVGVDPDAEFVRHPVDQEVPAVDVRSGAGPDRRDMASLSAGCARMK